MTSSKRLPATAADSPPPTCPLRTCADMEEIKLALGMPGATVEQLCERVRQLRQVELGAEHMQRRITCR